MNKYIWEENNLVRFKKNNDLYIIDFTYNNNGVIWHEFNANTDTKLDYIDKRIRDFIKDKTLTKFLPNYNYDKK